MEKMVANMMQDKKQSLTKIAKLPSYIAWWWYGIFEDLYEERYNRLYSLNRELSELKQKSINSQVQIKGPGGDYEYTYQEEFRRRKIKDNPVMSPRFMPNKDYNGTIGSPLAIESFDSSEHEKIKLYYAGKIFNKAVHVFSGILGISGIFGIIAFIKLFLG